MTKLRIILAGTAVAMFSQFAAAQSAPQYCPVLIAVPAEQAPTDPNDPRYIDQSRLNYTADPYVKRRIEAAGGTASCPTQTTLAPNTGMPVR